MLLEFAGLGDLRSYVKAQAGTLTAAKQLSLASQVIVVAKGGPVGLGRGEEGSTDTRALALFRFFVSCAMRLSFLVPTALCIAIWPRATCWCLRRSPPWWQSSRILAVSEQATGGVYS
jgi:hypothetical protein